MDHIDHLQAHVDALEQQTEYVTHQTQALEAQPPTVHRQLTCLPYRFRALLAIGIMGFQALSAENFRSGRSRRHHRRSPGAMTSNKTRRCAVCDFTR